MELYGMPSAHSFRAQKSSHRQNRMYRRQEKLIKTCQDTSDGFELCSAIAKARPATASTDVVVLSLLPQASQAVSPV